jgi:hypothetical protein
MSDTRRPASEEVEILLRNADLRTQLEPFLDESVDIISEWRLPTEMANEYLESMLAWEAAPILPISQWFQPELQIPHPDLLSVDELRRLLWETIRRLYEKRIVLDFTDHLSDTELYLLIFRDILSAREKKIDSAQHFIHWDCADTVNNPETWLRYYATAEERDAWQKETHESLPARAFPPYPRCLPRDPR